MNQETGQSNMRGMKMQKDWSNLCTISPSLISCCDMCNIERDIRIMEKAGIEILHVDILDGHFSPSMPIGLDVVKRLRSITKMKLDIHLMSTNNIFFINELIKMEVDQILFHIETEPHVDEALNRIKAAGIRTGVALKPGTSLNCLDYIYEKCDAILLMLINPGYASSKKEGQVTYAKRKYNDLLERIKQWGKSPLIELDGRISRDNIQSFTGENTLFVAGSTCLNKENLEESIEELLLFSKIGN